MYNLCVDLPCRLCAEEPFTRIVTARSAGCSQAILDVGHAHMLTDLDYMRTAHNKESGHVSHPLVSVNFT